LLPLLHAELVTTPTVVSQRIPEPCPSTAAFQTLAIAGVVDQDPPHGLGGGEEVAAVIELLVPSEPQVRLLN
jgi:hypothetical protein